MGTGRMSDGHWVGNKWYSRALIFTRGLLEHVALQRTSIAALCMQKSPAEERLLVQLHFVLEDFVVTYLSVNEWHHSTLASENVHQPLTLSNRTMVMVWKNEGPGVLIATL